MQFLTRNTTIPIQYPKYILLTLHSRRDSVQSINTIGQINWMKDKGEENERLPGGKSKQKCKLCGLGQKTILCLPIANSD